MRHNPITEILILLLIVAALFCPIVCADQGRALIQAASKGDLKLVQELLDKGVDVNAKDKHGWTALMTAVVFPHPKMKIAKVLLDKGADVNAKDESGKTALLHAARNGHVGVMKLLLDKGADVNSRDYQGHTPLIRAAIYGSTDVVKLLLKHGVDPNARDNWGTTALMYAVGRKGLKLQDFVSLLRRRHLSVRPSGRQARNDQDIVSLLLQGGAHVNTKDNEGTTALIWASKYGGLDYVIPLLHRGADPNSKDNNGRTALEVALERGNTEIVGILKAPAVEA